MRLWARACVCSDQARDCAPAAFPVPPCCGAQAILEQLRIFKLGHRVLLWSYGCVLGKDGETVAEWALREHVRPGRRASDGTVPGVKWWIGDLPVNDSATGK